MQAGLLSVRPTFYREDGINDLRKTAPKKNAERNPTASFWASSVFVVSGIIGANDRGNAVLERLIDRVLKFVQEFDLSIYRLACEILVSAPHVDGVEDIDAKPLKELPSALLKFTPLASISHETSHNR